MKKLPRVALLIQSSRTYGRGRLRGIADCTRIHGTWSVCWQERELHSGIAGWLKGWRGDGIIARIENRRMARELSRLKIPVVDVLNNEAHGNITGFEPDEAAVARLAADFFIKAGFQTMDFCGLRGIPFSDRREAALAAYLSDDVLCSLSEPSLTSIQPGTERLGYEAAARLGRMLQGEAAVQADGALVAHDFSIICPTAKYVRQKVRRRNYPAAPEVSP